MRNKFQQRGFTLIELLVVIVILGILSTISVGTFRSYFAKARDSERVSAVQNIAMMIKVDSGGSGNCGVYNYTDGSGGISTADTATACAEVATLDQLMLDNDFNVPEGKNGLNYFYGFELGATEGSNDFFIAVGAEEDKPQNGKKVLSTDFYVFVDGTTGGITSATAGTTTLGTCTFADQAPDCEASWAVYPINSDGTLGTAL